MKLYWRIPPEVYDPLHAEFNFDFDPCPNPRPENFDGLVADWGMRNWINPPFTGGVMKWLRRAIAEQAKGKLSVIILPTYQVRATAVLDMAKAEVRYIGLVRWLALDDMTPNPCKQQDLQPCIVFILRP